MTTYKNKATEDLVGTIAEALNKGNLELQPQGIRDLLDREASVMARVPGQFSGARRPESRHRGDAHLLNVAAVVRNNPFPQEIKTIIAAAFDAQIKKGAKANAGIVPGASPAEAKRGVVLAANAGLVTTADKLPPRGERGRALVSAVREAAARGGGRGGLGRNGRGSR
jgi:hypothetical protein